jgi:glyoxylase-like metal-dependent hydrolase (beta-lactamase superfamily II)
MFAEQIIPNSQAATMKDFSRLMIDRRALLTAAAGAGLAGIIGAPAYAAKLSSIQTGQFKITTFSDGHLGLPATMFAPNADPAARKAALAANGQNGDTIRSPLNVTLIETPSDKILVDVGSGPRFMGTAGKLTEALEAAGISPEDITKIIFTHAHPDHLWGTINDFDELNFPNAAYHIAEAEWNFWMAKDVLSKLPADRQGFAVGAQRHLKAAGAKLKTVKPGTELVAGVNILSTPGHTPGHISLEVGAGKDAVVILGDALTHPVISFKHYDWQPASDQDATLAVATRKRLLDKLASDHNRLIGYHLPMPGLGRVERKDGGYQFAALA